MRTWVAGHIERSIAAKQALLDSSVDKILAAGQDLAQALQKGHKLLCCGNGGSAADAQHIATELLIRYKAGNERPSLPALSLAADSSALTACANDFGFEQLFARQIEGLGQRGDILLGITTSGNSQNIREALRAARARNMCTILLSGRSGGSIMMEHPDLVDHALLVPTDETSRIQECHIMIGQMLCAIVEKINYNLD